jgi:hypothetical protein
MFKQTKTRNKNAPDPYLERTKFKAGWSQRLKQLTRQASKDNNMDDKYSNGDPLAEYEGSPSATGYQEMKDPLRSDPSLHRQASNVTEIGYEEEEEIYLVAQSHGYCSIIFSILQTIILIIMMAECGVAPLNVNPMVGPYPGMCRSICKFFRSFSVSYSLGTTRGVGHVTMRLQC